MRRRSVSNFFSPGPRTPMRPAPPPAPPAPPPPPLPPSRDIDELQKRFPLRRPRGLPGEARRTFPSHANEKRALRNRNLLTGFHLEGGTDSVAYMCAACRMSPVISIIRPWVARREAAKSLNWLEIRTHFFG